MAARHLGSQKCAELSDGNLSPDRGAPNRQSSPAALSIA